MGVTNQGALRLGLIERTGYVLRNCNRQLVLADVTTNRWRVASKGKPDARRAAKRAEARADRVCAVCGEALEAVRSSRHHCSTKCRVAAPGADHRRASLKHQHPPAVKE